MGEEAQTRPLRAALDTNVAVSALVFRDGRLAWLRVAWAAGRVTPVVSGDTAAELLRVLGYPKFRLTAADAKGLLGHYMAHAEAFSGPDHRLAVPRCRDPGDRMFLLLAYASGADALVSGDRDLLAVAGKSRVPILAPEAFRDMVEGRK